MEFLEDTPWNTTAPLSTHEIIDFEIEEEDQQQYDHLPLDYDGKKMVIIIKWKKNKLSQNNFN